MSSKVKCDAKKNLPDAYITFNPSMLDDDKWTFRDLQKLCMKLNIGGRGDRAQLIERLQDWHRKQFNYERRAQGSNFSLLEVELPPSPPKPVDGSAPPRRTGGVSPSLLSPLKTKPKRNNDGTPVSILRPDAAPRSSEKKRLNFSIFNQTKIIPPREAIQRRWAAEDGEDFDALSDDECAPQANGLKPRDEIDAWLTSDDPLPAQSPASSRTKSAFDSDDEDEAKDDSIAEEESTPVSIPQPPALHSAPRPLASASTAAAGRGNIVTHASSVLNYASTLLKQAATYASSATPTKSSSTSGAKTESRTSAAATGSAYYDDDDMDMQNLENGIRTLYF